MSAPGIDAAALGRYLADVLPGPGGAVAVEPVSGGQSNPTFFVERGGERLVLRKQPPGELLPSAHAVDREFRVLAALRGSGVPVPDVLHFCADRALLGTPFYVMRRVEGTVHHDGRLAAAAPGERRAMYRSLARTLARLHRVDPAAVGLADFGRPGDYFARQIGRWTRQWALSREEGAPDANLARLARWLPENVPAGERTAIAHGDYRLGNVVFAPGAPAVAAVLDWELSTLGHPLADLAHCCMTWHIGPDEYGGVLGVDLAAEELPSQGEFEDWYGEEADHALRLAPFHMAFALFRFAVVFEGIAARARQGNASGGDATRLGRLSAVFAERAARLVS